MSRGDAASADKGHDTVARVAAIIGPGLVGGSLALALKARRAVGKVIAVARTEETLLAARELGVADETTHDLGAAVAEADLVVLATPVLTIIAQLTAIAPHLRPGCLVTDTGSTKAAICCAAEAQLPAAVDFVGGHPMAGSEQTGVRAARADLFEGATWVLTPTEGVRPQALDRARRLVAATGARALVLSPEEHDEFAAAVSHVPHLLAAALAAQVGRLADDHAEAALMAAGGFRDLTRVADADPGLWRDIFATNQGATVRQMEPIIETLQGLVEMLGKGDMEALREFLHQARELRRRLDAHGRATRGE